MNSRPESESEEQEVPYPLVIECDLAGRGLQMSEPARAALGQPEDLRGAVGALALRVHRVRFSGLMESTGRVWISTQADAGAAQRAEPPAGLSQLQTSMVRHYFRLQEVERRLARQARAGQTDLRGAAIRQVEMERGRLGRELHTGVGQMLAAIRLQLDAVDAGLPDQPIAVRQALGRIATLSQGALDQVRAISRRLHPPEWQRLPLETAIRQLWELSGIPERFESTLNVEQLPEQPALELKTLAYRAAQEAFSNLARHAKATRVDAAMSLRDGTLVLTIIDNGVGFNTARLFSAPASIASGIGLRSIREQAEALSGEFVVESGPSGTTLKLSAPFLKDG